jgi:hypothetical protein
MPGFPRRKVTEPAAARTELPKIVLQITRGRAQHLAREVRSTAFLIGTAPDCDLVLADPRFDPVHSYVYVTPDRVTIRQLGEGPALSIDGRPTPWAVLFDGDRLQMGSYEFQVRIEWPAGSAHAESTPGQGEALPLPTVDDRAAERLLREVERGAETPRLTLFVGDDEGESDQPARRPQPAIRPSWQPRQKKASL